MKQKLNELLASVFMLCLALATEILTMIYGWGLKPQRWLVIIGLGFFANMGIRTIADELREKHKDAC